MESSRSESDSELDFDLDEQYEPRSEEEARRILDFIRAEKGSFNSEDEEELAKVKKETRRKLLRKWEKSRRQEGLYTRREVISEQLYSSKFRFIYELIQNADDACDKESTKGRHLTFSISRDEFIADTYEESFKRANVRAICATGESSKKAGAADDHIGEKGFGFKSVFAVADTVHVQSGLWSFRFEHKRGEDGLGMVTPIYTPRKPLPVNVGTRIRLSYTQEQRKKFDQLVNAVREVPETATFFLPRLRKITIRIVESGNSTTCTETRRVSSADFPQQVKLVTRRYVEGTSPEQKQQESICKKNYHTIQTKILEMPEEQCRLGRNDAEVQLAFPYTGPSGGPSIDEQGQYIFAFLPLYRQSQIPFLIQSDFVTAASREAISDCDWNQSLRRGVAKAFLDSVVNNFTQREPMLYQWVRFLPKPPIDPFWKPLYVEITELLRETPAFQSWEGRKLRRASELRIVPQVFLHEDEPLFPDLLFDRYLAPDYSRQDHHKLKELGLKLMSWNEVVVKVEEDLQYPSAKLKKTRLDDSWHDTVAELLLGAILKDGSGTMKPRVGRLSVVPLQDGSWVSLTSESVYFPHTEETPIPKDLSFKLVHPLATAGPKRKELYTTCFGVSDCDPRVVIKAILERHSFMLSTKRALSTTALISHFVYLYRFEPKPDSVNTCKLCAVDDRDNLRLAKNLYFRSDGVYDTDQLLTKTSEEQKNAVASFLHPTYLPTVSRETYPHGRSWKQWLEKVAGIRYFPPLANQENWNSLSPILIQVLKDNPVKFVGTLQSHWETSYEETCFRYPALKEKLKQAKVPCENDLNVELQGTYLPLRNLKKISRQFGVEKRLPFIQLSTSLDESNYKCWRFLEEIDVGHEADLHFYLAILEALQGTDSNAPCPIDVVIEVYRRIGRKSNHDNEEDLRKFFHKQDAIYVPDSNRTGQYEWKSPDECVWNGPCFLALKSPLESHYGQFPEMRTLFVNHIQIKDATSEDLLEDLRFWKTQPDVDVSVIQNIYSALPDMVKNKDDWNPIRQAFDKDLLVFSRNGWRSPKSCLWESTINISGKVTLDSTYPDLRPFFVDHLRIKTVDAEMLLSELIRKADSKQPSDVGEVKHIIISLASMLRQEDLGDRIQRRLLDLKGVKFLPVKQADAETTLRGIEDDFVIIDNARYWEAFRDKLDVLDFNLEQSRSLDPFWELLELDERYLSEQVREDSYVGDRGVENKSLSEDFQLRAYSLYCCAVHFKSEICLDQDPLLFHQLQNLKVFTTDDIWTELSVEQNGRPIKVKSEKVSLKIVNDEQQLIIYVPKDTKARSSCFRSLLPRQIGTALGIKYISADLALYHLLTMKYDCLEDILEEHDISEVSWIEKPEISTAHLNAETSSTLTSPDDFDAGAQAFQRAPQQASHYIDPNDLAPIVADASFNTYEQPHRYRRLLDEIITSAASENRSSTDEGSLNLQDLADSLAESTSTQTTDDLEAIFGERGSNTFPHFSKMGAVGELYVFEKLSRLGLPDFDRKNWRSRIRGNVTTHPNYEDMPSWNGTETADLVYEDRSGKLTDFLKQNSHGSSEWAEDLADDSDPIEYYLEVKTTTGECRNPFYMSYQQYNMMYNMRMWPGDTRKPRQIYVIIRVFNLLTQEREMKIFVDPWREVDRALKFADRGWEVTVTA